MFSYSMTWNKYISAISKCIIFSANLYNNTIMMIIWLMNKLNENAVSPECDLQSFLWLRLQTSTNHLPYFCAKNERDNSLLGYFILHLLSLKLQVFFVWVTTKITVFFFVLWWRSHLVTGQDCFRCLHRSRLWDNFPTPLRIHDDP